MDPSADCGCFFGSGILSSPPPETQPNPKRLAPLPSVFSNSAMAKHPGSASERLDYWSHTSL
jgi:hypothetical protein